MKRSTNVTAPLLASAAFAFLAGCRQQQMKRCVDDHNMVVDDSLCDAQQQRQQQQQRPGGGVFPVFIPYHYYYGGTGGFGRGSVASGGSITPRAGVSYSTARSGFGSTHASGSSGHGAAGE
jgi:hypothetical protein